MLYDPQRANETSRRLRIWELENMQCPVIGTCFSLAELRKFAGKLKLQATGTDSDYELHAFFVGVCQENNHTAKFIQKRLDAKFSGALRRYSKFKNDDALRAAWRADQDRGDIPGPFWAVVTHPATSEELRSLIFAEVHMLSHLVGASNRADIRRLADLEKENERLQLSMQRTKDVFADRLRALRAERDELAHEVRRTAAELTRERSSRQRGEAASETGHHLAHELEVEALRRELSTAQQATAQLQQELAAQVRRNELLQASERELASEKDVLEAELSRLLAAKACPHAGKDDCPGPTLCGLRILYVGGRPGLLPQYRALVESYGGELLHHDGGMEESSNRLESRLVQADLVVCPVDCVSHEASLAVKAFCKRMMKPCCMMRTSGVSSLAKTLTCLPERFQQPQSVSDVVRLV